MIMETSKLRGSEQKDPLKMEVAKLEGLIAGDLLGYALDCQAAQ